MRDAGYLDRRLSVDFSFTNVGEDAVLAAQLTDSINTSGVICETSMPVDLGDIQVGGQVEATLAYLVPPGVGGYRLNLMATATDAGGWHHQFPYNE